MTLDEAISHALKVARQNEDSAILYKNCKEIKRDTYEVLTAEAAEQKCLSCAADHRQLAEWLTDYKELKNSVGAVKLELLKEAQAELEKRGNMLHDAIEELEEAKRLLKMAVEDINSYVDCYEAHCDECCCTQDNRCHWKHEEAALKLIGEDENET